MPRWTAVGPALFAAATLASCSIPTDKTVSRERLQAQIVDQVTGQSGAAPVSVDCPDGLAAVVGASLDCIVVGQREQRRVSVTVGGAEGDQVDLYIVQSIGKDIVARQITEEIARRIGRAPESVACPADLKGDVGATLRCVLTDEGQTYGVTVTTVDRGDLTFDFAVDEQPH